MEIASFFFKDEDIYSVFDQYIKYNFLQLAVINNIKELVNKLVEYSYGYFNLKCNISEYLVVYLGYYGILEVLLERGGGGGGSGQIVGMCYLGFYFFVEVYKIFGFLDYFYYKCYFNVDLSVFYVIFRDNVSCVKFFLIYMQIEGVNLFFFFRFFYFACCKGIIDCFRYFVEKYLNEVNFLNFKKEIFFFQVVVWGRECVKCFIDNGVDVKSVFKIGETVFYRFYCNDIDGLFIIYDIIKYLLIIGIEQLVNEVNILMEIFFYYLVIYVLFIGGNFFYFN